MINIEWDLAPIVTNGVYRIKSYKILLTSNVSKPVAVRAIRSQIAQYENNNYCALSGFD